MTRSLLGFWLRLSKRRYSSIDNLPWWNWRKVLETGDRKYLFKNINYNLTVEQYPFLYKSWIGIYDEYMIQHGTTQRYKDWIRLRKKKGLLCCEYLINQKGIVKLKIKAAEKELEDFEKQGSEVNYLQVITKLSEKVGFRFNEKEVTVSEVFTYLND